MHPRHRRDGSGTTLLELVVTTVILAILAGAALPIAAVSQRRQQELELRRALRELRSALDTYHRVCVAGVTPPPASGNPVPGNRRQTGAAQGPQLVTFVPEDDPDRTCYPKELAILVEGVETNIPDYTLRFLRRIPRDPFNWNDQDHDQEGWRLRSTTDGPDSISWDWRNVFDVYSGSEYRALDGSNYPDW